MAIICEFGTAPEHANDGYRMACVITGSDTQVLGDYKDQDVRLVRGALVFGTEGVYEFAVMAPVHSPSFTVTAGHIESVLRAYSLRVANSNGQSFADMSEELICEIDVARVERAALAAAGHHQQQVQAALDEIKDILVEEGVLEC